MMGQGIRDVDILKKWTEEYETDRIQLVIKLGESGKRSV